jgi:hypothetical protein
MKLNQETFTSFRMSFGSKSTEWTFEMKRYIAASAFLLALAAAAVAQNVKLTFSEVAYPDGREGTIQTSVKTNGNGSQITVCTYFSDPNEQFLGQFQANTNFSPVVADDVKQFCLAHFGERQTAK